MSAPLVHRAREAARRERAQQRQTARRNKSTARAAFGGKK